MYGLSDRGSRVRTKGQSRWTMPSANEEILDAGRFPQNGHLVRAERTQADANLGKDCWREAGSDGKSIVEYLFDTARSCMHGMTGVVLTGSAEHHSVRAEGQDIVADISFDNGPGTRVLTVHADVNNLASLGVDRDIDTDLSAE